MSEVTATTVTANSFMTDVVEASAQVPVLVDFWAPWCGPCRQLMPILDRLVADYGGRFKLAKVNTDEQQELAAQIGVRSLPTVVLFKDRTAVDHFVGLAPESQIRQMLDKHLGAAQSGPLERAQAHKANGDYSAARQVIEQALVRDPENIALLTERAELQALDGDLEAARQELAKLQGIEPTHAAVKRLAARLAFADVIAANPDIKAIKERAGQGDLDAQHALAVHQLLGGDVEPALNAWLTMLREQPRYKDELARKSLIAAFEVIGEADPIVPQTRRLMARMLF